MSRRKTIVVAAVFAAAFAGCRADPYQEVREREWRRLEDEIYCRDGIISNLEAELDSCRRENDALKRRGSGSSSAAADETLPVPNVSVPGDDVPPEELKDFAPPKTDLGTEAPPPLGRRTPSKRKRPVMLTGNTVTSNPAASSVTPPTRFQEPANATPLAPATTTETVCAPAVTITFNRRITGGNDTDGRFGDEGILAVIEPRDATGQLVSDPGEMRLTLYDPGQAGGGGAVAQWDFTAAEVAARFRSGPFGTGVNFELPWPNRPPRRANVRLEVRCTNAAGQTLVANHKFAIDVPTVTRNRNDQGRAAAQHANDRASSTPAAEECPPWQPTRN